MARGSAYRWQGWAVRTRTDTELRKVNAARARRHAEAAAERIQLIGSEVAPLIAEALPEHTGWLTMDDVCVFADLDQTRAEAGCEVLADEGLLQTRVKFIEAVGCEVKLVRRSAHGMVLNGPLKEWLTCLVGTRFNGDIETAAETFGLSVSLLRRRLDADDDDRVLLQAVDLILVRADAPHMLAALYPYDEAGAPAESQ